MQVCERTAVFPSPAFQQALLYEQTEEKCSCGKSRPLFFHPHFCHLSWLCQSCTQSSTPVPAECFLGYLTGGLKVIGNWSQCTGNKSTKHFWRRIYSVWKADVQMQTERALYCPSTECKPAFWKWRHSATPSLLLLLEHPFWFLWMRVEP